MDAFMSPIVYALKHKDLNIRMASRSGGVFTALSDYVFERNGIVYGCVMDKSFNVFHLRADNKENRDKMRGSKYVQSDMLNIFKLVKADLNKNKYVLFTGTSCQIAGLKSYLSKNYENLLCVDIVCHGVPSPLVFKKYIEFQEKNYDGRCVSFDFRNKKDFGWANHIETLKIERSYTEDRIINSNIFTNLFYQHHILRPACYSCPYKDIVHPGDITIADYWGIDNACPGFNDNKGVSLVLINNRRGERVFNQLKSIEYVNCRIEDSIQPPLEKPFSEPSDRKQFWNDFKKYNFSYLVPKYAKIKTESNRRMFVIKSGRFIKKTLKLTKLRIIKIQWELISIFK